ncbi:hypothetical protein FA10DRAFT_224898 [Acaromyces ingoldii]|uniref:chitin synthase n=1 Tax=Acaromyces ingoldii TaxID=215250 RepID=A0A316YT55_9BASI|nr:hypothetical protein FA10DRAFT_224898 [Acaromyces ingoldii]PWN92740.1 hypothetical protein FA10DRAFT_224898 [Acaromyces ingoldii]
MGERRGSAATGISDLPELSRSRSNVAANNRLLDPEAGFSGANPNFKRKKSLVRPDRERMDPSHRQWYYRNHAANMDAVDASGRQAGFSYMPSKTGHLPQHGAAPVGYDVNSFQGPGGGISGLGMGPSGPRTGLGQAPPQNIPPGGLGRPLPPGPGFGGGGGLGGAGGLRRGKSILGRDEDQVESSLNILKRGVSLRRSRSQSRKEVPRDLDESTSYRSKIAPGPVGPWMMYCYVLTICCPAPFLSVFGMKTPEQQRAWREKIGLVSIIALCMAFVGFITFGFTQAVCDTKQTRYYAGKIDTGSTVFHGYDYNFNSFFHPTNVGPFGANTPYNHTNPAYSDPWLTGSKDASMLFQKVGDKCTNFLNNTSGGGQPTRYFTCTVYQQNGNVYRTNNTWCHDTTVTANFLQPNYPLRKGQVSWDWKDVQDPARNLAVWKGAVIDFSRLNNLLPNVSRPALFTELSNRNAQYAGKDVSAMVLRSKQDDVFDCLEQIISVGYIDSMSIGCVASKVELYVSLVFIIGVVAIKFMMAVIFGWFLSWRLGNYANETYEERMKRAAEIEQWTDDIYRPAPAGYRPNAKKHRTLLPTTSRFSTYNWADSSNKSTPKAGQARTALSEKGGTRSPSSRPGPLSVTSPLGTPPGSPSLHGVRSSTSLAQAGRDFQSYSHGSRRSSFSNDVSGVHSGIMGACPFPLHDVVPQPPPDYQPFNFPLAHSICLVTAYSESFEGLRTTLDSLATTDYPNSHKLLLVIADGIVKGAGSEMSTPDICLSMMKDFVVPPEEVEGNSYVAIADGYKRHNMAKIYAGFYEYDDETVERSKQQRVPMILVAKCGTPMEADSAKPGNRGKRDSQVLLMAFMQKVMFDERMTLFDYEFFNSIWRVTGISPDHFEIVLMVDADTKVFPDSLSRMVACMVEDPEIMGLCGETKIANKAETWVTMIQVFEYYISHHQTKAFEACFGGVTCLPGCFSAYRIKAPKGPNGYWVPILANPDIVEHYSENVVDTLHKKNLLLLGEDRYLTTLMLKTFPKRKMMFVPQAVCKTIVPDTFRILLSQRRRWINSTVHNLFELVMVNDLCGTFCFSMRFVVFMELVGTLVLPAAIAFTLYVIAIAIKGPVVPTVPLVLLGIILGLPGLLIVVTSRKIAYVGWMLIYLLSLPIWNFAFPSYAFWHMDDFSWGATRIVQGDKKGSNHGDAEGKFDPTNIIMKRWAEFERERRWKSGTHSRDSTYDVVQRTGSPERSGSTRYSVVSSDTYHSNPSSLPTDAANRLLSGLGLGDRSSNGNGGSGGHGTQDGSESGHAKQVSGGARARLDSVPLLELPAPLGPDAGGKPRALAAGGVPGSVTVPRPRDLSPSTSNAASIAQRAPAPHHPYESYPFTSDEENRPMMGSPIGSPDLNDSSSNGGMPPRGLTSMSQSFYDPVRHGNVSSEQRYPGVVEAHFAQGFTAEPEEQESLPANAVGSSSQQHRSRPSRGFSLVDDGPVASPQGVRQVTRGARRMSSVNQGSQAPTSPSAASQSSAAPTNYASERGNGRFSRH